MKGNYRDMMNMQNMVDCHHNNDTFEDNDNNLLVISCYTPILTFF